METLEIVTTVFLLLLGLGLAGAIVYLCIGAVGLIFLIPQVIAATIVGFIVTFIGVVIAVSNEFLLWCFRNGLSALGFNTAKESRKQTDNNSTDGAGSGNYNYKRHHQSHAIDPYQILQVAPEADPKEIKAAYLKAMAQYHPDKVSHLGDEFRVLAEEKAKNIQQAYSTLYSG
jgi:hypothetical protein